MSLTRPHGVLAVARVVGLLIYLGFMGYDWVQTTIGQPISWANFYELRRGMTRQEAIDLFGVPTQTYLTELSWEGSNGWIQISFDNDGGVLGRAHEADPQFGIKKVWRKTYLPYAWLSYFVELRHP